MQDLRGWVRFGSFRVALLRYSEREQILMFAFPVVPGSTCITPSQMEKVVVDLHSLVVRLHLRRTMEEYYKRSSSGRAVTKFLPHS